MSMYSPSLSLWAVAAASRLHSVAPLLCANRGQVSDRAIEASGEAGISLKVLYLDQSLHMLQPGWDSVALPIVLTRVEA